MPVVPVGARRFRLNHLNLLNLLNLLISRSFRTFSCHFVRRVGGVSCSAGRRGPQGWRWRACAARRSRGKAPSPTAPSRRKSALRHAAFRVSRVSASQSRQSCQSCLIPHLTRNLHIYINAVVATRRTTRGPEANFILPRLRLALLKHTPRVRASPSSPPPSPRTKAA